MRVMVVWCPDWSVVAADIMAVYETVTAGASIVHSAGGSSPRWARLLRGRSRS